MKRIVIAAALVLGTATAVAAQTAPQVVYKDLIRPNGQPRSAAVHQADVDACYAQTGGSRYLPDSAAMKKCMLGRGYRFVSQSGFDSGAGRPVVQNNWRIHVDGAARGVPCMTLQAQVADTLENTGADPALIQALRTRCLPQDHNPADYDPTNPFYVAPNP